MQNCDLNPIQDLQPIKIRNTSALGDVRGTKPESRAQSPLTFFTLDCSLVRLLARSRSRSGDKTALALSPGMRSSSLLLPLALFAHRVAASNVIYASAVSYCTTSSTARAIEVDTFLLTYDGTYLVSRIRSCCAQSEPRRVRRKY